MSFVGASRWDKGVQQMTVGTQKQEAGDLVGAAKCYEFGIQMMIDHLKTLPSSDRKTLKQAKVESYMDILEKLKLEISSSDPNAAQKLENRIVKPKPKAKAKAKAKANANANKAKSEQQLRMKPKKQEPSRYHSYHNDSKTNNNNVKTKSKSEMELYNKIANEVIDSNLNVSFSDVIGLSDVKQALLESVILPSQRPDLFTGCRSPPNGILLFGPPGNGKTFIAKALATESECTFFNISASSLTSRYVGDSEKMVRALFECARDNSPSIVFIDEIDSLLTSRGNDNEHDAIRRMKTEFLVQMDGVNSQNDKRRVLLMGATNLPWQLDDAVLRRFERRIMVDLPDFEQRKHILISKLNVKHNLSKKDFNEIVNKTDGYSASDLNNLVKDACMGPIRDLGMNILNTKEDKVPPVEKRHFLNSLQNIKPSANQENLKKIKQWNQLYGSKLKLDNNANNSKNNKDDYVMKSQINDNNDNESKQETDEQSKDKPKSKWGGFSLFT